MAYQFILVETNGRVGIVKLNRPDRLNALNDTLREELVSAVDAFDADENIGCIVITGSEKAFAAGADITQMVDATPVDMLLSDTSNRFRQLHNTSKPTIAAVSGWALGGGCELAMSCDMIVASETATFGQPEINIGIIPGAGGTQRLTRAVGKAIAMEMVLNGRFLSAEEAHQFGLVNRVVPADEYLNEAIELAQEIAERAPLTVRMAKEAVNKAFETTLSRGHGLRASVTSFFSLPPRIRAKACGPSSTNATRIGRESNKQRLGIGD